MVEVFCPGARDVADALAAFMLQVTPSGFAAVTEVVSTKDGTWVHYQEGSVEEMLPYVLSGQGMALASALGGSRTALLMEGQEDVARVLRCRGLPVAGEVPHAPHEAERRVALELLLTDRW